MSSTYRRATVLLFGKPPMGRLIFIHLVYFLDLLRRKNFLATRRIVDRARALVRALNLRRTLLVHTGMFKRLAK